MFQDALFAGVASLAVTTLELLYRNQRPPWGDRKSKAVGWWLAVLAIDVAVAIAMIWGLVAADVLNRKPTSQAPGWVVPALVGALGPLSLRSPIRRREIAGQESGVGITVLYDVARVSALYALDERLTRLRRRDVSQMGSRWHEAGLEPEVIAIEIREHIWDHPRLSEEQRERIESGVSTCMSFPTDIAQLEALIKLLRSERLSSLIDEFDERSANRRDG